MQEGGAAVTRWTEEDLNCPPPEGYVAWHEWAEAQYKAGLRQKQCTVCGRWLFPQEQAGHKHYVGGSRRRI